MTMGEGKHPQETDQRGVTHSPAGPKHALVTVALVVVFMFTAIVLFDADPQIPLVFSCLAAGLVALWERYTWEDILEGMIEGVTNCVEAVLILLLIGMLVAAWIAAGTVPTLIYYGLKIISVKFFVPATMLLCTIIAFAIGSWGTIGTVGIAFLGVGIVLGLPTPLVAGAIISGSYLGELISPLTDATNLSAAVVGENVFHVVRRVARPALVALVLAEVLYTVVGLHYAPAEGVDLAGTIDPLLEELAVSFRISPLTLLPMVVIAVCLLVKIPAIPSMLIGVVAGAVVAAFLQGVAPIDLFPIVYEGFVSETGDEMIDGLLTAGGMDAMLYTISIIIIAMAFGGIMQKTGQMEALVTPIVRHLPHRGTLEGMTVITCIVMNMIIPDQYLGISLPGQMYADEYDKRGISRAELGAILLGGGAVTSPIVPWNTCGIYCMTILGISATSYLPFTFYSLLLPVVFIVAGFLPRRGALPSTS